MTKLFSTSKPRINGGGYPNLNNKHRGGDSLWNM